MRDGNESQRFTRKPQTCSRIRLQKSSIARHTELNRSEVITRKEGHTWVEIIVISKDIQVNISHTKRQDEKLNPNKGKMNDLFVIQNQYSWQRQHRVTDTVYSECKVSLKRSAVFSEFDQLECGKFSIVQPEIQTWQHKCILTCGSTVNLRLHPFI